MPEITISKSEKYREVIHGEYDFDEEPQSEEEFAEKANHNEATNAFLEDIGHIEPVDDPDVGPTWDDCNVSKDSDLVAKIATYFEGMSPDETTGRLRAKLRLLEADTYIHAQLAAQSELRHDL